MSLPLTSSPPRVLTPAVRTPFGALRFQHRRRSHLLFDITISTDVVKQIAAYRQRDTRDVESGGLLGARLVTLDTHTAVLVDTLTTPQRGDIQGTHVFVRSRDHIEALSRKLTNNTHFVGEWHTHSSDSPPGASDLTTLAQLASGNSTTVPVILLIAHPSKTSLWLFDRGQLRECSLVGDP